MLCQPLVLFDLGDQLPPVKNLTVTNVGPTYFTVHWNVSIILRVWGDLILIPLWILFPCAGVQFR